MGTNLKSRGGATLAYVLILKQDPCCYCGSPPPGTLDHIIPRSAVQRNPAGRFLLPSGMSRDHWSNLTAACLTCNIQRQFTPLLEFLRLKRKAA